MTDPRALIQRAQAQTQANRYAFVLRAANAKLVNTIRATK
jgi:uncharacterized protein (DUF1778 family)